MKRNLSYYFIWKPIVFYWERGFTYIFTEVNSCYTQKTNFTSARTESVSNRIFKATSTWLILILQSFCLQIIQGYESFLTQTIYSDYFVFHVNWRVSEHIVRVRGMKQHQMSRRKCRDIYKATVSPATSDNQSFRLYYYNSFVVCHKIYLRLLANDYFFSRLPSLNSTILTYQYELLSNQNLKTSQLSHVRLL